MGRPKRAETLTNEQDDYELILICGVAAFILGMLYEGFNVFFVHDFKFSLADFGIGVGSLLGGIGAGYGLKRKLGDQAEVLAKGDDDGGNPSIRP